MIGRRLLVAIGLLLAVSALAWAQEGQYGPTRAGESLWRIFHKAAPPQGTDRYAWMIAAQRLNPAAFAQPCNANSLKRDVVLNLPSERQIAALSPTQAAREAKRQADEWEHYRKRRTATHCSEWFEGLDLALLQAPPVTEVETPTTVTEEAAPAATTQEPAQETAAPRLAPPAPAEVAPATSAQAQPKEPEAITEAAAGPSQAAPALAQSPPPVAEPPTQAKTPPAQSEPVVLASAERLPAKAPPRAGAESPPPTLPGQMQPSSRDQQQAEAAEPQEPAAVPPWYAVLDPGYVLLLAAVLALILLGAGAWLVRRARAAPSQARVGDTQPRKAGGYRRRILLAVTLVVVVGQGVYAYLNVYSFQQSYLQSVQSQSIRLADYLRQDIENVLKLGIPLRKLIKIEESLGQILNATPELEFLEITDLDHRVYYYADHQTMEQVDDGNRHSATLDVDKTAGGLLALDHDATNLRVPFTDGRSDKRVGYIQMRISPELIQGTTREIIWDIITVILVSLLITFEFLGFFINHGFSEPLRKLTANVRESAQVGKKIEDDHCFSLSGIGRVIANLNRWIERLRPSAASSGPMSPTLQRALEQGDALIGRQLERLAGLAADAGAQDRSQRARESLQRIRERIATLLRFGARQRGDRVGSVPEHDTYTPYSYIRPFVFLFFIAYNLPLSFFPMFVETLYEPLWGLPEKVLIGLPISVFMLFFAMSMLAVGRWLDRSGWYKPLLIGISVFMGGFVMTAFANGYMELLLYRAVSAVGLGIGFMGFQQFVIENTDSRNRNMGLASFLGAFFAGEIVGTVIGGMLAERLGYTNIFLMSGIVSGLALVGLVLLFRRQGGVRGARAEKERISAAQIFGALRDREFLAVVIFQAIPAKIALVGFLMYFVPLYLAHIGTLQSNVARIAMCYALMLVLVGPLISRKLAKPSYRKYYILVGGLLTGGSMALFAFASEAYIVLLLVAALGIAHAFSLSSQASLIAETRLVSALGMGAGMGVYRFWERVGNVAGPFIMAGLIAALGYQQAVVTLGIGIVLSSLLYIALLYGIPAGGEVRVGGEAASR